VQLRRSPLPPQPSPSAPPLVMRARRPRLVDCRPRWVERGGIVRWITFDCPEGHVGCLQTIPFTPALDGSAFAPGHAVWQRVNESFETLTLSPSIRRNPRHASREEAIAAGCLPEYVDDSLLCAMHVNLTNGIFEFAGDSR
jgi:hypothetical protein